jgi:hypothetical protein
MMVIFALIIGGLLFIGLARWFKRIGKFIERATRPFEEYKDNGRDI